MNELTLDSRVGQWAACHHEALPVLERHGVDFCCGGDLSLEHACHKAGIDPRELLAEVHAREGAAAHDGDWNVAPLAALCDHIEQTHHAYLREKLPWLSKLIDKVVAAHVDRLPELHEVRAAFAELRAELEPHMLKEERILFPAIRAMERAGRAIPLPFGTVQNPIRMMRHEHDQAGDCLRRLRDATDGYAVAADACTSYRVLLTELERLESDLHLHIHQENNILFPRAEALEDQKQSLAAV